MHKLISKAHMLALFFSGLTNADFFLSGKLKTHKSMVEINATYKVSGVIKENIDIYL